MRGGQKEGRRRTGDKERGALSGAEMKKCDLPPGSAATWRLGVVAFWIKGAELDTMQLRRHIKQMKKTSIRQHVHNQVAAASRTELRRFFSFNPLIA